MSYGIARISVGGAVIRIEAALKDEAGIIAKIDGDGQMDPNLVSALVSPIKEGRVDYVKGNRFHGLRGLAMPPLRLFGNAAPPFRKPQPATGNYLIQLMASLPSIVKRCLVN